MTAKILQALHAIMAEVGYVQKGGRNAFHNYRYAGEADLLEKLRPAMVKHGLILIPSCAERSPIDEHGNTHVAIDYTLAHKDGEVWPDKIRAFGSGNDRNSKGGVQDKGTYKAITGANKYLLFKLFQIETGDDPEKDEETAPAEPPAKPAPKPAAASPFDEPKPSGDGKRGGAGFQIVGLNNVTIAHHAKASEWFAELKEILRDVRDPAAIWALNGQQAQRIVDQYPKAQADFDACLVIVQDRTEKAA